MTIANVIAQTSATGGTGSLTLAVIASGVLTNASAYTDVWGTSGNSPWADYQIDEYTDSTCLILKQSEWGTCPLVLATPALNRTATGSQIRGTYVFGTGYKPSATTAGSPTAINFGSTSANIRIFITPFAGSQAPTCPFRNDTNAGTGTLADLLGWQSWHEESINNTAVSLSNLVMRYFSYYVARSGLYSKATVAVTTGNATSVARWALYDDDGTGWAGALRQDWVAGGGTQWDLSSTGLKTCTLTTPIYIPASWYIAAVNASVTGANVAAPANCLTNPMGSVHGTNAHVATLAAQPYGAFANTGIASSTFAFSTNVSPSSNPVILLA